MSGDSPGRRPSSEGPALAIAAAIAAAALLCVLLVGVIGGLIILGPAIGNVFSSQVSLMECSFKTDVIVFEDRNADQFQDPNEAGIKDVGVEVMLDGELYDSASTNDQGLAKIDWYNTNCQTVQTFEIVVDVPSGYQATTETTFGPYPVMFMGQSPPLHVGLK